MKRGRKKSPLTTDEATCPSSFQSSVGWCWMFPHDHKTLGNSRISNEFSELEWVRRQVVRVVEVTDIADPLSGRLVDESRSTSSVLFPRVTLPPTKPSISAADLKTIFIASWNRSDSIKQVTEAFEQRYPEASLHIVLGQWWVGHRRTWPIQTKWSSVYWYQCHDVVLPELLSRSANWSKREPTSRMALVVSEDSSIRRMWLELLPQQGFQVLAASKVKELPEGIVDVVFFEPSDGSIAEIIALRKSYPSAKIVACFSFPEWNQVQQCIGAGADIILGKPFHMEGLKSILADWTLQE